MKEVAVPPAVNSERNISRAQLGDIASLLDIKDLERVSGSIEKLEDRNIVRMKRIVRSYRQNKLWGETATEKLKEIFRTGDTAL